MLVGLAVRAWSGIHGIVDDPVLILGMPERGSALEGDLSDRPRVFPEGQHGEAVLWGSVWTHFGGHLVHTVQHADGTVTVPSCRALSASIRRLKPAAGLPYGNGTVGSLDADPDENGVR